MKTLHIQSQSETKLPVKRFGRISVLLESIKTFVKEKRTVEEELKNLENISSLTSNSSAAHQPLRIRSVRLSLITQTQELHDKINKLIESYNKIDIFLMLKGSSIMLLGAISLGYLIITKQLDKHSALTTNQLSSKLIYASAFIFVFGGTIPIALARYLDHKLHKLLGRFYDATTPILDQVIEKADIDKAHTPN
ncbi:MAG: hypothetical protein AABX38_01895 [Candidatus Micrarchaeota archaeon]